MPCTRPMTTLSLLMRPSSALSILRPWLPPLLPTARIASAFLTPSCTKSSFVSCLAALLLIMQAGGMSILPPRTATSPPLGLTSQLAPPLPLSLAVVLFELTGGLTYIVPFMLAVLTAKWVGDMVTGHQSVYDTLWFH